MKKGDLVIWNFSRNYLDIYKIYHIEGIVIYLQRPNNDDYVVATTKDQIEIATPEQIAQWMADRLTGNDIRRKYESY